MDAQPHRPFVVRDTDEGCAVVDAAGEVVARASERWLADLWAAELNERARVRRRGEGGEPPGQEDPPEG